MEYGHFRRRDQGDNRDRSDRRDNRSGGDRRDNRGGGDRRDNRGGGDRGGFRGRERDSERDPEESVFSQRVRAGKRRTYFFDVRKTRGDDFFITITESTRREDGYGYKRHKIFLYKEDFNRFVASLNEVVDHVKTELMPDFDYEEFDRRQAEWEAQREAEDAAADQVASDQVASDDDVSDELVDESDDADDKDDSDSNDDIVDTEVKAAKKGKDQPKDDDEMSW